MVGVAACGTVNAIKAVWETRIRKVQEEEKRRKTKGGVTGRSDLLLVTANLTIYNNTHVCVCVCLGFSFILVCEVASSPTFSASPSCFRLDTSVWEDRLTLAKLREKLQSEDGRLILRIEQEDWKVKLRWMDLAGGRGRLISLT